MCIRDRVSREVERRTIYTILAHPLGRSRFLLGKFGGMTLVLGLNLGIMGLGLLSALYVGVTPLTPVLGEAMWGIFLQLLVIVAFSLFFSCWTTSTLAAILSLALYVAGHLSEDLLLLAKKVDIPWVASVLRGVYLFLPHLIRFDLKGQAAFQETVPLEQLGWMSAYGAVLITLVLTLAMLAFRWRDLK